MDIPTKCDICKCDVREASKGQNQIVDGRLMSQGSWAWMCLTDHAQYGVGLGTGKGQLFDVTTGKKVTR